MMTGWRLLCKEDWWVRGWGHWCLPTEVTHIRDSDAKNSVWVLGVGCVYHREILSGRSVVM